MKEKFRTNRVRILLLLFSSLFSFWFFTLDNPMMDNRSPITFDNTTLKFDLTVAKNPESAVVPWGSIYINNDTSVTFQQTVTLTLDYHPTETVSDMRFSNDGVSWSTWEAPVTQKVWTLSPGYGHKTVYYQIRDAGVDTATLTKNIDYGIVGDSIFNGWGKKLSLYAGIPGDGLSWETAYRIENWTLNSTQITNGIKFENVHEYLIIQNNNISYSTDTALKFLNCTHTKIINNNFTSCGNGIVFINSSYITIEKNYFRNMSSWMLNIGSSYNLTIQSNELIGTHSGGISIGSGQTGMLIQYNNITNHMQAISIEGTFHNIHHNLIQLCTTGIWCGTSPTTNISYNIMNQNGNNLVFTGSSPVYQDNYDTVQAPDIFSSTNYLLQWTCLPFASYYYVLNYSTPITEINSSLTVVGRVWGNQFNVTDQEKMSYYIVLGHQDYVGNSSMSNCVLISTAPSGTISIDNGATYTNDLDVTLSLTYSDIGSGVDQVRYSNDSISWTNWEAASVTKAWTLPPGDGQKTVYYEIRDKAGLITQLSDTIVLDTWAPTGTIVINSDAAWTNVTLVTLTLTYNDDGMGVDQVQFSNDSISWTPLENPLVSKVLWLSPGDGMKNIYYRIWDLSGNFTILSDSIGLDLSAPSGTITINSDLLWTNITAVSVALTYSDGTGSGIDQVHYSNDSVTWTSWETVSDLKTLYLLTGDGTKTIYYEIRDKAGNIFRTSDTIGLDTTAPTGIIVINSGASWTNWTNISLSLTYNDGLSGVDQIRLSNDSLIWMDWQSAASPINLWLSPGDGTKTIYYEIRDNAGMIYQTSDTIGLDTTAPTGSITINFGSSWTGSLSVTLSLIYADAGIGVDQVRYSNDSVLWTNWESAGDTKICILPSGDGSKTIYYEIRDLLGYIIQYSDAIGLDTTAPSGTIIINTGATWTTSTSVTLSLTYSDGTGSGIDQVRYGHPGDPDWWTNWESVADTRGYTLPSGDGLKTVLYEIRDNVGLVTQYSDTIVLDTLPPSGSITIQGGLAWISTVNVMLSLTYSDSGSNIDQVRYSNDMVTWTDWETASASRSWTLISGDGLKTVYYEIRDNAGFVTRVSDSINLDTTAPTGSIIINLDTLWTKATNVTVTLTAGDGTGSGVDRVRYSNDSVTWTIWDYFYSSRPLFLTSGDGSKTIYYEIRDGVGLITRVSDTIELDMTAPTGSISINSNAAWCNATNITLILTSDDGTGSGIDQIHFSNDSMIWTDWEVFSSPLTMFIPSGDGQKTVFYEIRDNAGNIFRTSDTIGLDTTNPTGSISINNGAEYVNITSVSISLTYNDGGSGISEIRFSNDSETWTDWQTPESSRFLILPSGDGLKTIYYQVSDNLGWVAVLFDTITLDTIAPSGTIMINNGSSYTNTNSIYLNLTAVNGGPGFLKVRFSNDSLTWSTWEDPVNVRNWTLITGDGVRWVYYEIIDQANNTYLTSDSIDQDVTKPTGSIIINDGDIATNDVNVHLDLTYSDEYSGVDKVRFSNDSITWSDWEDPLAIKLWTIASGEGVKTVFYQIRDMYGLISEYNDTIAIDNTDPTGSIIINLGAEWTSSTLLSLSLTFDDIGAGVDRIRFSNDSITWSDWQLPVLTQLWTVSDTSGNKTVFYQVRDKVGRFSVVYNDTIILDNIMPAGTIVINNNAVYTSNLTVNLTLTYSDEGAGVHQVRYRAGIGTWTAWESPVTSRLWTLSIGEGQRIISYQIQDKAGNIAEFSDTIVLDTVNPFGNIEINKGQRATQNTTVQLDLIYEDTTSGVAQIRFSNDGITYSEWEQPIPTKTWILNSTLGSKTVYYQIRDNAGNIAEYTATITLVESISSDSTEPGDNPSRLESTDIIVLIFVVIIIGSVIGAIAMKARKTGTGSRNDKYRATAGQKAQKPKKSGKKPKVKLSKAKPPKTTKDKARGNVETPSDSGIVDVSLQFQKKSKK